MTKAATILNRALELDASDRASLARELVLSLEEKLDAEAGSAWTAEIQHRSDELHAGRAKLHDAKAAVKRTRAKLAPRRAR